MNEWMNEFARLETWEWQKRLLARTIQLYKVLRGSPLNVQFSTHRDVTMHILFFTTFHQLHKTNAKYSSGTSSSTWKCNESCLQHLSVKCTWMLAYDAIFFIDFMICNANELFKILEITKEDRNQFTAKHQALRNDVQLLKFEKLQFFKCAHVFIEPWNFAKSTSLRFLMLKRWIRLDWNIHLHHFPLSKLFLFFHSDGLNDAYKIEQNGMEWKCDECHKHFTITFYCYLISNDGYNKNQIKLKW